MSSSGPARASTLVGGLLHAPLERASSARRWAYPPAGMALVSLFAAYHLSILLIWISPGQGLARQFRVEFLEWTQAHAYFQGTRNTQSWAMFAPDPNRTNGFIQILVTDARGEVWDLGHDIWGEDRWPYLFYDRRAKVNRRLDAKKHYQRIYAAWVCREWTRRSGGEAPRSVRFVRAWTRVPEAKQVLARGGWDPWQAPVQRFDQGAIPCASAVDGQLPNDLRARYGLEPVDDREFRPTAVETWWTERERERIKADEQAERDVGRARWRATHPTQANTPP